MMSSSQRIPRPDSQTAAMCLELSRRVSRFLFTVFVVAIKATERLSAELSRDAVFSR